MKKRINLFVSMIAMAVILSISAVGFVGCKDNPLGGGNNGGGGGGGGGSYSCDDGYCFVYTGCCPYGYAYQAGAYCFQSVRDANNAGYYTVYHNPKCD